MAVYAYMWGSSVTNLNVFPLSWTCVPVRNLRICVSVSWKKRQSYFSGLYKLVSECVCACACVWDTSRDFHCWNTSSSPPLPLKFNLSIMRTLKQWWLDRASRGEDDGVGGEDDWVRWVVIITTCLRRAKWEDTFTCCYMLSSVSGQWRDWNWYSAHENLVMGSDMLRGIVCAHHDFVQYCTVADSLLTSTSYHHLVTTNESKKHGSPCVLLEIKLWTPTVFLWLGAFCLTCEPLCPYLLWGFVHTQMPDNVMCSCT